MYYSRIFVSKKLIKQQQIMLTQNQFIEAMSIISINHSNKVVINRVVGQTVNGLGKDKVRLELTDCVPTVVNNLKAAGFSLSMTKGHLLVTKHSL